MAALFLRTTLSMVLLLLALLIGVLLSTAAWYTAGLLFVVMLICVWALTETF